MRKYSYHVLIISICAGLTTLSDAAQVYKCISAQGAVMFSDSDCPSATQRDIYQLNSPMTIPALPPSSIQQALSKRPRKLTRVTVIADNTHPCGAFDATERRSHLVRQQVTSGMSQAEVDSMFGKPIKLRRHNGTTHATYRGAKGEQRSVRFNQHGCVP